MYDILLRNKQNWKIINLIEIKINYINKKLNEIMKEKTKKIFDEDIYKYFNNIYVLYWWITKDNYLVVWYEKFGNFKKKLEMFEYKNNIFYLRNFI